jgi:hypothetical protein
MLLLKILEKSRPSLTPPPRAPNPRPGQKLDPDAVITVNVDITTVKTAGGSNKPRKPVTMAGVDDAGHAVILTVAAPIVDLDQITRPGATKSAGLDARLRFYLRLCTKSSMSVPSASAMR